MSSRGICRLLSPSDGLPTYSWWSEYSGFGLYYSATFTLKSAKISVRQTTTQLNLIQAQVEDHETETKT